MKKGILCVLAVLLLLTGCKDKKSQEICVTDALCPYRVENQKNSVCIELQAGEITDPVWRVQAKPEEICQVTLKKVKQNATYLYEVEGKEEGFSQIYFEAAGAENPGNVCFRLLVTVYVDAEGKVLAEAASHQEIRNTTAETGNTAYQWSVDLQGTLTFRLLDTNENWRMIADGGQVCRISGWMSGPSGWRFEAKPLKAGEVSVLLERGDTGRRITVQLQVDSKQNISVAAVQE